MTVVHRHLLCLLILSFPATLLGQSDWFSDTLTVFSFQSPLKLSHSNILQKSETVTVGSRVLPSLTYYSIDYRNNSVAFSDVFWHEFKDSLPVKIVVTYRSLTFNFKERYSLREMIARVDSTSPDSIILVSSPTSFQMNDVFGDELQKSGSIIRGFTVGSNRDLSLTSGFRMQFSGKLSSDIDVTAALTDEHTPIQPEGNTQTLQEVDKVFIGIQNPSFGATLGDFNIEVGREKGGEFGRIARKVQGAQGTVMTSNVLQSGMSAQVSVAGAIGRGKFHSMRFQGKEGNQGPYRLSGKNGERLIIVIAGSERVFLDGQPMVRGEINDYTIDYASAEVTFSSRRLITSASRIVVDFEYSDRQYERNLVHAAATAGFFDNKVTVNTIFTQESDDGESPIDFTLDDGLKSIISQAGNDKLKASVYGAVFVGRDSATAAPLGQYVERDTVIGGQTYPAYFFAPGDTNALYSMTFSRVDVMPADSLGYVKKGIGEFQIAGVGGGNFLPLRFLPVPELVRTVDVNASATLVRNLVFEGELSASHHDQNRFARDSDERNGFAHLLSLKYAPRGLQIGSTNIGDIDLRLSERTVDDRFVSIDRFNEVEFGRKWNIEEEKSGTEHIRELSILYKPLRTMSLSGSSGWYNRDGAVTSNRLQAEALYDDSSFTHVNYRIEDLKTKAENPGRESSWIRQLGTVAHQLGFVTPEFHVESELRETRQSGIDSLEAGSFAFLAVGPGIRTDEFGRMRASAEFEWRSGDSAVAGDMRSSFRSFTQRYTWELREWQDFSSALSLQARKTDFSELARGRGSANSQVLLMRSQSRYAPLRRGLETDLFYELSNQQSARLERVFVRVAKGNGNYRYLGDLNRNTIAEENEFEQTRFDGDYVVTFIPGETLYPVVDVKTSLRIRFHPSRFLDRTGEFMNQVLSAISTETYFRIDERSSDPNSSNIYFLRSSKLLTDQYTITGSNLFTQDLHIFESQPDFSVRGRYSQRKGLVQLVSGTERSYGRERSLRIRTQLVREIANQTELIDRLDQVSASQFSSRARDIISLGFSSEFSYRPEREWEIGFEIRLGTSEDRFGGDNAATDFNGQAVRAVYAYFGKGQLRSEIKREETLLTHAPSDVSRVLPFELTEGRAIGQSYLWSLALDYRLSSNLQLTLDYRGRTEGGRPPVHTARAEAKAFF